MNRTAINFCSHVAGSACVILTYLLALYLLIACSDRSAPEEVANAFCYRYLIELNQAGALELASGLAAENLRKEIETLKGNARVFEDNREFHRLKPFIDFKLVDQTQPDEEHAAFIYDVNIESRQDNEKITRQLVVSTIREQGKWWVSNFRIEDKVAGRASP